MILIAVTPSGMTALDQTVHHDYLQAVIRAGALPLVLPLTDDAQLLQSALDLADGVLVTGGADIHPKLYGEEKLPCCGSVIELRDTMESFVLRYALEKDMPLLCICRGMQLCNCVLGGSLYQDLEIQRSKEMQHSRGDKPNEPVHDAHVEKGTLLHKITGRDTLRINSRHHQGVKKLAPGAIVNALSPDGLVEGFEVPGKRFALAVQWHPESLSDRYQDAQQLFDAFKAACENP